MTISNVVAYLFAQTSDQIFNLKQTAYQATAAEKFAYRSPDAKIFRNKRPAEELITEGWIFGKVKFMRVQTFMSPKHELWPSYVQAKRRANVLMAARLILKANQGVVPTKAAISSFVEAGVLESQGPSRTRKSLGFSAHRLLTRVENRRQKHPEKFKEVLTWLQQRQATETTNV